MVGGGGGGYVMVKDSHDVDQVYEKLVSYQYLSFDGQSCLQCYKY